jgi:hypothetical protein
MYTYQFTDTASRSQYIEHPELFDLNEAWTLFDRQPYHEIDASRVIKVIVLTGAGVGSYINFKTLL